MKPAPFAYVAVSSRQEALELLKAHPFEAKVIAGGQSLVPLMSLRFAQIDVLVDLNRIADLAFVRDDSGAVSIGAMTRARDIERSPVIAVHQPLLTSALGHVGHPQIRNRGTLGGSLAHADPAAEMPATAVALGATMVIAGAEAQREVPAAEFFLTHFSTVLAPDEILTEIRFPPLPPGTGTAFLEVSRRHGDFALVGVAVTVTMDGDGGCRRIQAALAGVADRPVEIGSRCGAMLGSRPTEELARDVGRQACAELDPSSDIHAGARYRKRVAAVLLERAILSAAARAVHN